MVVGKLLSKLPSAAPVADGNLARDQRLFGACWNTIHPILEWIRPLLGLWANVVANAKPACCAGLKEVLVPPIGRKLAPGVFADTPKFRRR